MSEAQSDRDPDTIKKQAPKNRTLNNLDVVATIIDLAGASAGVEPTVDR